VVVAMPCGWDAERAVEEVQEHALELVAAEPARVWAVDAASSFSRPGPRLVEGTELLAHLLHPDRVEAPAGVDARALRPCEGARKRDPSDVGGATRLLEEVRTGDLAVPRR
jgi:iron complex transport system substrate-binding protein